MHGVAQETAEEGIHTEWKQMGSVQAPQIDTKWTDESNQTIYL